MIKDSYAVDNTNDRKLNKIDIVIPDFSFLLKRI